MKKLMQHLPLAGVAMMVAALLVPHDTIAQDAAAQDAAMQASQQAMQQAQQAAQQASDDAQRAAQQAMQDSVNAAQSGPAGGGTARQKPVMPRPPNGAIPAQIAAAHAVFVASLGAAPNSPMDATEAYNQFASDLMAWGHYAMAATPAEADLLFELKEIAPLTRVDGFRGDVQSYATPAFALVIREAKTRVVLWTVVSPIEVSGRRPERERWYSLSVRNVVSRVKVLTRTPLTAQETADLVAMPKTHYGRNAVIVGGVVVGAGVAGALILHHLFESGVNSQKEQQDQFCEQHGIR